MEQPIRIVLVDNHQIFIEGLKLVLGRCDELEFEVIAELGTGNALLKIFGKRRNRPRIAGHEPAGHERAGSVEYPKRKEVTSQGHYDEHVR